MIRKLDITVSGEVVVRLVIDVTVIDTVVNTVVNTAVVTFIDTVVELITVAGHCLCRPRCTTATLPTSSAAATATSPTRSLRARGLALATFIRHVKTFPYGNRSREGAECRRAQASLLRYVPP